MGLFDRRPLGFFAFLCVAFSLFGFLAEQRLLVWGFGILLVALVILCILFFALRRRCAKHVGWITGIISLAVAVFAVGYSLLNIAIPIRNAEAFVGERVFVAEILRTEDRVGDDTRYSVKLLQIDEVQTSIAATLTLRSDKELSPKDRVAARGWIEAPESRDRNGALLAVSLEEDAPVYWQSVSEHLTVWDLLKSPSGIMILSERAQDFLRERMTSLLGERSGALSAAFFVGDRSALSDSAVRDFSRAGVSHLMAVSGLHFSVLLGALEILLRMLFCPKKGRLLIVTLASLFFLFLTGFAMSACRAALMLYAVYLTFLFGEEADAVTSLFCSFALIILISPYAVADLGLWMSFLATLGLLTVYPLIAEKIPRIRAKRWFVRLPLKIVREALNLVLITTVATLFLLPILWVFWGEFSSVSLLTNPILSPVSYLFLIGIPVWLAVSPIPWLGSAIGAVLQALGNGILSLVSFFSRLPSATVSLNYEFCRVLIPLFAIGMIAVLVIRLRRKWLVLLPPLALMLSFVICFAVVQLSHRTPSLHGISVKGRQELLWIADGDEVAVCDLSGGSSYLYRKLLTELSSSTATEIQSVVLTHYHQGHLSAMELLLKKDMVRTLYLPMPRGAEQRAIAAQIWASAVAMGSDVVFYEGGEIALTEHTEAEIVLDASKDCSVAITVSGDHDRVTYLSAAYLATCTSEALDERIEQTNTVVLGAHGGTSDDRVLHEFAEQGSVERIVLCGEGEHLRLRIAETENYLAPFGRWWSIELP